MFIEKISNDQDVGARICWLGLLTLLLAFTLRLFELPVWQNPEFSLGTERLLATNDAYHWVVGAEGLGLAQGHPMSVVLQKIAEVCQTEPATVAFWCPAVMSCLVALLVFIWVWQFGSPEAGVAAGLLASVSPGFLGRTLLGFYDTDLVTLFFPLAMTLAPACWWKRRLVTNKWLFWLGLSGLLSWWTQEWHSVFPYLIRYNAVLLIGLAIFFAPPKKRRLTYLGALSYALPALAGPAGFMFNLLFLASQGECRRRTIHFLIQPVVLFLLGLLVLYLVASDGIFNTLLNHAEAYLKHSGDLRQSATGTVLVYPSVAQSIVEVQDLDFSVLLSYFYPWPEAGLLGLTGFLFVVVQRPGMLFLVPLAVLALLSTKLGGRMVMFGAPILAIGLTVPLFQILCKLPFLQQKQAGLLTAVLIFFFLVTPFFEIIPALSQGPIINRRHADALRQARSITPENSCLWLWWDWGYAAHHFARRQTIADGAQHAGPSLYLPAAVFATDNPRFARQLIRYTASKQNEPANVFTGLDGQAAQQLMEKLSSPATPLIENQAPLFIVVSFEMLRLGYWINNFGNWNFVTQKGQGGVLSIVPQALSYRLSTGEVRLEDSAGIVEAASISVFEETGVTYRNYIHEWFAQHPNASPAEQKIFLQQRRNVHFLFNRVTDEKIAMDERIFNSLMVQLLLADAQDQRFSPYFRLVYDNVFARIYEVL